MSDIFNKAFSVQPGDIVFIEKGTHKGSLALLDDEEGPYLVCYLSTAYDKQGPICVRPSSIRLATDEERMKWFELEAARASAARAVEGVTFKPVETHPGIQRSEVEGVEIAVNKNLYSKGWTWFVGQQADTEVEAKAAAIEAARLLARTKAGDAS